MRKYRDGHQVTLRIPRPLVEASERMARSAAYDLDLSCGYTDIIVMALCSLHRIDYPTTTTATLAEYALRYLADTEDTE